MTNEVPVFNSIEDIERQKTLLRTKIEKKEQRIGRMWHELFHKERQVRNAPSSRLMKAMSVSAGIFDGALLGWKLYRRFKR